MSPVPRFEAKTKVEEQEESKTKETAKKGGEEEEKRITDEQSAKQKVEVEIVNGGGQERETGEEDRLKEEKESESKRNEEGRGRRKEEEGGEKEEGERSLSRKEEGGGGGGGGGGGTCIKRLDDFEIEGKGRGGGEEERLGDLSEKAEERGGGVEEKGGESDIRKKDCGGEEGGGGGGRVGGCVKRLGEEEDEEEEKEEKDCDKLKSKRAIEDDMKKEKKEDNSLKEEKKDEEERQNRVLVETQCKEEKVKRNGYVDGVTTNECKAKKDDANGRGMEERNEGAGRRHEKLVEIAREALDETGNGVVMFRRRNSATPHDNDDVTSDVDDHVTMRLPRDVSCETLSGDNSMAAAVSASDAIACGLPLRVFEQGYLCLPYLSLPYLDLLSDQNVSGYVVGATNVLFKQKRRLADVLVEVDGARMSKLREDGGGEQLSTRHLLPPHRE
ncbi:hypothetical protein LSTR_LSTR013426 [Laodelphax striatellus]|uniref:AVL9/DENND6 domain-containing protein n=1 Tax=Laodelphax striatellus TaxID=195883 RepID=A0A482WYM9_LAOST|nr:hypothetical protein LSTR_LSTR013426 [Laodelphax striatellus]